MTVNHNFHEKFNQAPVAAFNRFYQSVTIIIQNKTQAAVLGQLLTMLFFFFLLFFFGKNIDKSTTQKMLRCQKRTQLMQQRTNHALLLSFEHFIQSAACLKRKALARTS